MGLLLLLAPLLVADSFDDVSGRFSIDLPAGWKFAPQPGDTSGAAFRRELEGVPAHCFVKVLPVGGNTTLAAFAAGLLRGVESEAGFRLISEDLAHLGGVAALRRRYVVFIDGDPKWPKMAEDLIAVDGRLGYIVHVETLAEAFANFESEFTRLFDTMRLPGQSADAVARDATVGRWEMVDAPGTFLILSADGTFSLDSAQGTWRVEGRRLVTRQGGGQEFFNWRLEEDGAILVLSSSDVGADIRYRRATAPAAAAPALAGRWGSETHSVVFGANGTAMFDQTAARYELKDGRIVVRIGKKQRRVSLRYELTGEMLLLKGWRFGAGHQLQRVR